MTKDEYILRCDVLLNKLFYKSDAPWVIEVKVSKNLETATNRLQFNWIKCNTQHRVHLYSFDTEDNIDSSWEQERFVTITDVMSFMTKPEEYQFAIRCILSSNEFYEDLEDGFEPMYLKELEELSEGNYSIV